MPNLFDSLIHELKSRMSNLTDPLGTEALFRKLKNDLPNPTLPAVNKIRELADTIDAFHSQVNYTTNTSNLLNGVPPTNAKLEDLNTATNLVQFYFQVTQPLDQVLSNLKGFDLSTFTKSTGGGNVNPDDVSTDIQKILRNRKELQQSLNNALREFSSELDELHLENLVQISNTIVGELKNPAPTTFNALSFVIDGFIDHLKSAKEFFKAFSRKSEDLTGNEPSEIKQLARNWGDAVTQIETLEQNDLIRGELNNAGKSRAAIAQSIKIHDLLEANYDYVTALVRSGDLESAGIL
jgi:hypothetical protein